MRKVVTRERNKASYRVLHVPLWIWVFFVLPGHMTFALFLRGPDYRHAIWLGVVTVGCVWRGLAGRLPGVEPRPYITHYGEDKPNLPYRVVCYTAAWIGLLVPFLLNGVGLIVASVSGDWMLDELFAYFYYPLALSLALATVLDVTPRARRSTAGEGAEKAWFYVALWSVVPAQIIAWIAWRLVSRMGLGAADLARLRLAVFLAVTAAFLVLGLRGRLPRTDRYYPSTIADERGNRK
jgi:hypothetical protein